MVQIKSAMRGVPVILQSEAADDETAGLAIAIPDSFKHHQILIKTSAGVASGAVQIETADAADYAGVWAPVTTPITVPAASSEVVFNFIGIYKFLRARISTVIAGGTIDVQYVGS